MPNHTISADEHPVEVVGAAELGVRTLSKISEVGFVALAALFFSYRQVVEARRANEEARKASPEYKIEQAVDKFMQKFQPTMSQSHIVWRPVIDSIRCRIQNWEQDATLVSGRHGAGKTVAVQEALRDMRGTFQFNVNVAGWDKVLYEELGIETKSMFKNVLDVAGAKLQNLNGNLTKTPILLLDVPRETTGGAAACACNMTLKLLVVALRWRCHEVGVHDCKGARHGLQESACSELGLATVSRQEPHLQA